MRTALIMALTLVFGATPALASISGRCEAFHPGTCERIGVEGVSAEWRGRDPEGPSCRYGFRGIDGPGVTGNATGVTVAAPVGPLRLTLVSEQDHWRSEFNVVVVDDGEPPEPVEPDPGNPDPGEAAAPDDDGCAVATGSQTSPAGLAVLLLGWRRRRLR